ncbi:hypothetical protein ACH4KN_11600 [Streptomyces sp. NPDC017546]|uniref:hypothetical protein n=1 Tax=unclassified Streptomyces TaxID=2593676 RepID=UPI00236168FD|nr:hypothetical protein [Streptomyces sp. MMBL 11-1]
MREVLIHSRHDTAVDALGALLNAEAGLADILQSTLSSDAIAWISRVLVLHPDEQTALFREPDGPCPR